MNEFRSVSALLDELAPAVEVEEPAWDDVLSRAEARSDEPVVRRQHGRWARPRVLTAVLSVAAAVAVAASALAAVGVNPLTSLLNEWKSPRPPGALDGTYSATLSKLTPARLDGHWTISFHTDPDNRAGGRYGTYVISHNGTVTDEGGFLFGGNEYANLILSDTGGADQCADTRIGGFYQLKYDSSALKLQATFDRCAHRRTVLSANVFTR